MECHECLELLYEFLDEELSGPRLSALRLHLEACLECEGASRSERRFLELVREVCTSSAAPIELRERIVIRLRELQLPPP